MFYRDFREEVEFYELDDHDEFKLLGTLVIAIVVALFNAKSVSFFFSSEATPYDGPIILMGFIGATSMVLSYFSLSYLTNVVLGAYNYVTSFQLPTKKETRMSFKMEKLFDNTLKNPVFYFVSLSLGHFLGAYERYTSIKTLTDFAVWETMPSYFLTYVKYPTMLFFFGIMLVTFSYGAIVVLQKPLVRFVANHSQTNGMTNWFDFFESVWLQTKSKSLLMTFLGLLPATIFTLHATGVLSKTMSLVESFVFYAKWLVIAYPLTVLILLLFKKAQHSKEEKVATNASMKVRQTVYDKVTPIFISEYIDHDVQEVIDEINQIVAEVTPYLNVTNIEEVHVLKRITEQEILTLISHYNKLPSDTKADLKQALLARLENAKEAAKQIAQISKDFHYQAFQKQADVMDQRYKEEKNA